MSFLETLAPHYKSRDQWKQKAWNALQTEEFPTRKWEAFRYVPLKSLYETTFVPLEKVELNLKRKQNRCVFVNGEFCPHLSEVEGAICLPMTEALRSYGLLLGKSWTEMFSTEKNPFHLLNHALYEEGLFLYVPPGVSLEIEWEFFSSAGKFIHAPKIEVFLGKGAELKVKSNLSMEGEYWLNGSLGASLDEGAHFSLEERLSHSSEGYGFHTKRVNIKRDAKFECRALSRGGKVERHDISATLSGENSSVDLKGLSLLDEKAEIHHHLRVNHIAPHTRSSQHYKTVLKGRSRSSFEGKIYVEKEAQKTDAYQRNSNLLLSPKAQAMSKPNLEIMADDVKASHGATVSQPNLEEMHYLRTRGLSEEEAKRLLIQGFCREIFEDYDAHI